MGNPFPGGRCQPDVCSPEVPCADPSVCISGRCKRRCEGIVCGVGASCDPATNKCVCNPYFIGNPDLLCMPRKCQLKMFVTDKNTISLFQINLRFSFDSVAIQPAICEPGCGHNAHCEYTLQESKCVCNPGTTGNPYHGCGVQDKSDCSTALCGKDAHCNAGPNAVECLCPPGYAGNPYIQCHGLYPLLIT